MRKNIHRLLAAALAFCMALLLFPAPVFAAEPSADQTADFSTDASAALSLLNNSSSSGSASWSGNTLTLNGISFSTSADYAVILPAGAAVEVYGDNTITSGSLNVQMDGKEQDPIYSAALSGAGSITFKGDGSLRLQGGDITNTPQNIGSGLQTGKSPFSVGLLTLKGDVTVNGPTVTAQGGTTTSNGPSMAFSKGVHVQGSDLNVYSGSLTGIGGKSTDQYSDGTPTSSFSEGISVVSGDINVTGGSLNGTVLPEVREEGLSFGFYTIGSTLKVQGGDVTGEAHTGLDITGSIEVSGGTLTGKQARKYWGAGISLDGATHTSIKMLGNLTLTGGSIIADSISHFAPENEGYGVFTVSGGTLTTTGIYGSNAFSVQGGTVILDNGEDNSRALWADSMSLGSKVRITGADFITQTHLNQKYSDTPVVFSDVDPIPLAITGLSAQDKAYDGSAAATLTGGTLSGLQEGHTVRLDASELVGRFADAHAGANKAVTLQGVVMLRGKDAYRYTASLPEPSGITAAISPCTTVLDTTTKTQTSDFGSGRFDGAHFLGVEVDGEAEAATGDIVYTLNGKTMTPQEITAYLKDLSAEATAAIGYQFTGTGDYAGAQASGTITVTIGKDSAAAYQNPFTDVAEDSWYYDHVKYVYTHDLMIGTSTTTFSPELATSRGMVCTILWRMAGSPEPKSAAPFTDVATGDYFAKAVAWAAETGVVEGYGNGRFGPNDPVLREQLAAMLYRNMGSPSVSGSLDAFSDGSQASAYAKPALCWAVEQKLMEGMGGGILAPGDTTTRAQAAAMFQRYDARPR